MSSDLQRRAYRPNEILRMIPLSRSKIQSMLATGELPSALIGGRRFVTAEAVEALLTPQDMSSKAAAPPQTVKRPRGRPPKISDRDLLT